MLAARTRRGATGFGASVLMVAGVTGATIAGSLCACACAPEAPPPASAERKPKIRVPMFVDPQSVRPTPRFLFTFDSPAALAPLRRQEKLDEVVAGAAGSLERCARLMSWTRRQWEPGIPNPYPPLDARIILRDIRRGFTGGFCAQYNYVLAQALQSMCVPARYVSLIEHEVIEAWIEELHRWVCLDPLNDTWYTDESGSPLSVLQIHRRVVEGRPVRLSSQRLVPDAPGLLQSFRSFAVWLKNDHVGSPLNFTDLEHYKVYFVAGPDAADAAGAAPPPPGSLTTSEPADLYPEGGDSPSIPHVLCDDGGAAPG